MEEMVDSLRGGKMQNAFKGTPVLNMLNTRYVTYNPENPPIENPDACGAAWFVEEVKTVKSADDEILALQTLDTRKKAVVNEAFSGLFKSQGEDTTASVIMKSYEPNAIGYEVKSARGGAVVFSEIYYPKGSLIVERDGYLIAQGTEMQPIVFTSQKPAGQGCLS